ncbi:flagellar filament capping protein FliD [Maridesulfovibrio sp. FT414]|uniref:flagellar filament capping protein FliD n=1 Tax=Maridesulfovibrio sp. FT414 TaxID=2979469 RepID=UPI003D805881
MADVTGVGSKVSAAGTKSSYWSGKTKFEKLGNGTDFGQIVENTIKQQGYHKRRLESWKAEWVEKEKSLKELNTQMTTLATALEQLDSIGEFMGRKVSSSDSDKLTALADSTAPTSPYNVEINQLARNDIWTSTTGFSSVKDVVSATDSKISISCGGKTAKIDVPGGTTVEGLVKMLNATTELKDCVQIEAIKTGNEYRLKFSSLKMGEANRITFNPETTLAALAPASMKNLQQGCNSRIKIDGFPDGADNWIERDTNTITDGSKGLTLNLRKATSPGTVVVNVTTDTEMMIENARKFVEQVNVVRNSLKEMSKYNKETKTASVLSGNYGVQLASQKFKDVTATLGKGFASYDSSTGEGDKFNTLSTVGIKTETDEGSPNFGLLVFDEDKFKKALTENPDGVAQLFSADYVSDTSSPNFVIRSVIKGVTRPGSHEVSYVVSGGKLTSATINGKPAKISGWDITAQGTAASGMAIRVDNHTDGTYSGTAGIKAGKAVEMIESLKDMTNPKNGILNIIRENYRGIIKNIDKKLDYESTRLDNLEKTLKAKYARLDAVLSGYSGKMQMLQGQIAKLGNGSSK